MTDTRRFPIWTSLLVGLIVGLNVGACSADDTSETPEPDTEPAEITVAAATVALEGHASEVAYWRSFCADAGDPVVDVDAPQNPGTGSQVGFDDQTELYGLPRGVFTSSASAGRVGDRAALFVPGFTGATRTEPGAPYLELLVRCGTGFHAIGLGERLENFELSRLQEALTSGIWDVDGDGRSDLVLPFVDETAERYFVAVLFNEGSGRFRFTPTVDIQLYATMNTVTPIDLNHDGVLDMYTSMMGEDFHKAVSGEGDSQARDGLFVFGSNRAHKDLTGTVKGLTGPGDLTTFSFVCVPRIPGGRGKLCWVATGHVNDFILEETAPLEFEVLAGLELPANATMGVSSLEAPGAESTTFVATNIGRPLLVRVTSESEVTVVSDEIPMDVLDITLPPRTGPNRPRVGWGVALEHFNNSGCPGFVIGNTQINSLNFLPIYEGAGALYFERDCSPAHPGGTQFLNQSADAGPLFQDQAISDYFQTIVTYINDDLCPDLILTTYPRDPSDSSRLLNDPTEMRALINRCDTPGNRVAFQLVPADYDARVIVTLSDGVELHGYLAQPGQAGTNDQVISMGLGDRNVSRACVHWGENSRWPSTGPQCVDSPSLSRINVIERPAE
ncbi:MAG: hypothetical protein ACI9OJ_001605 [Myxococcota bacterium]|jgi:hypothetical protein